MSEHIPPTEKELELWLRLNSKEASSSIVRILVIEVRRLRVLIDEYQHAEDARWCEDTWSGDG